MVYVCIDTNIYIKLLTDLVEEIDIYSKDGTKSTILEELNILARNESIKLLVPEIVVLELKKANNRFEDDFSVNYNKLMESISLVCDSLWSETRDIKSKLLMLVEVEKEAKIKYWGEIYKYLEKMFDSEAVDKIYLTPEILCQSQKRKSFDLCG